MARKIKIQWGRSTQLTAEFERTDKNDGKTKKLKKEKQEILGNN